MKCSKCEKEVEDKSRFCGNCGTKLEEKSELDIEGLAKICSKVWYVLGYVRAKSTKKELEKFEERIRTCDSCMFDWYNGVVVHWKEWVKENNEKNKKANGSKRTSIQKTQKPQVKE